MQARVDRCAATSDTKVTSTGMSNEHEINVGFLKYLVPKLLTK
jgi:hypothetical protein